MHERNCREFPLSCEAPDVPNCARAGPGSALLHLPLSFEVPDAPGSARAGPRSALLQLPLRFEAPDPPLWAFRCRSGAEGLAAELWRLFLAPALSSACPLNAVSAFPLCGRVVPSGRRSAGTAAAVAQRPLPLHRRCRHRRQTCQK